MNLVQAVAGVLFRNGFTHLEGKAATSEVSLWKGQLTKLETYEYEMKKGVQKAQEHIGQFDHLTSEMEYELKERKARYKTLSKPENKAIAAKELVILSQAVAHNQIVKKELTSQVEEADAVVKEAKTKGMVLYSEIKAAEAYIAMTGQLKLYNQALTEAEKIVKRKPKIQEKFKATMTKLNNRPMANVAGNEDTDWVAEADKIAGKK